MELLIGSGYRKEKQIITIGTNKNWTQLITLDNNLECSPDIIHDLNIFPYPFEDRMFDELHAYEVLEHCGKQGDHEFFFKQFGEFSRILKKGGMMYGSVPEYSSPWAWGDPSHTRVITAGTLSFLNREFYKQLGDTASSDFLKYLDKYNMNFSVEYTQHNSHQMFFILKNL